jgi:protease-4
MTEIQKKSINPLALILGIAALMFVVFLLFSAFYFVNGKHSSTDDSKGMFSKKRSYVAVIEVKGVIMDSKKILKNLKDAEEDKEILGVVLRLNSPGGSVAPSQEIYEAVKKFPKPLVATMGSVAASGAYYIAAGAKKVFANAGTLTGSIGVIMEFANLKKLYEWAKVERFTIKTGKFKDSGSEYRDMQPEEREYFQTLVQDTLGQFKDAVMTGRKLNQAQVDAIADGRVFTGAQALKLKMIDEIGTFDDAVDALAKELKLKEKPKLAYPAKRNPGLQDLFMGGSNDEEDGFEEESSFVDRLTNRVVDRVLGVQTHEVQLRPAGLYCIWNGYR